MLLSETVNAALRQNILRLDGIFLPRSARLASMKATFRSLFCTHFVMFHEPNGAGK